MNARALAAWAAAILALAGLGAYKAGLLGPSQPMRKLVFRKASSSVTMTLYRIGSKYGRLEERSGPGQEVFQFIVVREPDIWQIDPKTKAGRHTKDTGPFFDFHSPILPPDPGSPETLEAYRAKPLSSLEFGRELEFMTKFGAAKTGPEKVRGEDCDRYQLEMDGRTIVVLTRAGTDAVMETKVLKGGKTLLSFEYDSYEASLPADLSLFAPPRDVSFREEAQAAPGAKELGPGPAVMDGKAEAAALAALASFALDSGPPGHPWRMLLCGPGLWKKLLALDPGLAKKGTGTAFVSTGAGPSRKVPVQRFLGAGKAIDDEGLYQSKGFRILAKSLAAGKAHSASKEERARLYSMLPFEISGRPVTVIEGGEDSLLYFEGGGLLWLDLLPTR